MKKLVKFFLTILAFVFALNSYGSPMALNATGIDPSLGTASNADIFQDVSDLATFEGKASDMVSPAWLEILVLVSPANFPISTFLTEKTMNNIRGLAKAEMAGGGKHPDLFIQTDGNKTRFNSKYRVSKEYMTNTKEFSESEVQNYKLNWGEIAVIPFQDTVGAAYTGTTATSATITVGRANMWTEHSLVKVQNKTYADGTDLVAIVTGTAPSTNQITISSIAGTGGSEPIPSLTTSDRLTRMGTAFDEGAVRNDAVMQSPNSDYNYAQKFITSVVYSNWLMMTSLFTNYSYSMITNLALQDFRNGQEFAFMFGVRSETTQTFGSKSEKIRTTGGLTHFIDQTIEYGTGSGDTTITETDIVDFTRQMRVGNNGADVRYLFGGSNLIASLNKGVMNDRTRFVQKEYDTVYGLSFTVLYSFFGTINVTYAPLMDQSEYIDRGFLLDMTYIDKFVFQPFRESETDLVKLREYDGKSVDMLEAAGLVVRNVDCHFILEVKA